MNIARITARPFPLALVRLFVGALVLGHHQDTPAGETAMSLNNKAPLAFHAVPHSDADGSQFFAHDGSVFFALKASEVRLKPLQDPNADTLCLHWLGSSPAARLVGQKTLTGRTQDVRDQQSKNPDGNSRCFARIGCRDIYPGIDLVYYWNQGVLEYDFEIAPQADPSRILLQIDGVQAARLDFRGDLMLETRLGCWRQCQPVAYQITPEGRHTVPVHYLLLPQAASTASPAAQSKGSCLVQFALGPYDQSRPLIIDPTLSFASPLGGSLEDRAYAIAVDAQGCVYVAGQTTSTNIPGGAGDTQSFRGASDIFVVKYANDKKSILFSILLGGSGDERPHQVAVTPQGRLAITGTTSSRDFPVKDAYQENYGGGERDAFLTVLDGAGGVMYSTYLGGSDTDELAAMAVDAEGRIIVAGTTQSGDLPVQRALQSTLRGGADGLIARFTPDGKIDFCGYMGGSGQLDGILDVAVDAEANIYMTGYTSSSDFPTVNPMQSAYLGGMETFVAKLNANGVSLVFATFLGGTGDDVGRGIMLDKDGGVIICGDTTSDGFPIANPLYSSRAGGRDIFLTKLDTAGTTLVRSTYLGGQGDELASLSVDGSGNIWLAGVTSSRDFPITSAFQPSFGGGRWDGFLTTMKSDGFALLFSTFLGGTGQDQLSAVVADNADCLYVAGSTTSTNIPVVLPLQPRLSPDPVDAYVAWITPAASTNIFGAPARVAQAARTRTPVARRATRPVAPPVATNVLDQLGAALPFFGKNLVVNGDAERVVQPTSTGFAGWETDEGVRLGSYAEASWLKTLTNGGQHFFLGLTNPASGRARQKINLAPGAPFFDSGDVKYNLAANLCGWERQSASSTVVISFLDSKGNQLGQDSLGPITGRERSYFNRLIPITATGSVPVGTRDVALELSLSTDNPTETPACADNIQLILLRPPAPLLQVTRTGNQVKLSWPAIIGQVIVEASPFLPPAARWQVVTNTPSLINGQQTLELGVDMANLYFRLRRSQ